MKILQSTKTEGFSAASPDMQSGASLLHAPLWFLQSQTYDLY